MKTQIFFATMAALLMQACKQEELLTWDPYVYPETPDTPYIWQVNLLIDTGTANSMRPIPFNDHVFCAANVPYESSKFFMVNRDGLKYWVSDDEFEADCSMPTISITHSAYVYGNKLTYLCNSDPRCIDLNTGEIYWHYEVPGADHGPFMSSYGNKVFHTYMEGSNPFVNTSVAMGDIETGNWDTLYYLESFDDFSVEFYPPGVAVQDNGDTIILFHCRMWRNDPYTERTDLYAYNITTDSLVWLKESIDPDHSSTPWWPVVYDNKAYFQCVRSVICLDVPSGNILWTWETGNWEADLNFSQIKMYQGKLFVKPYTDKLYALDPYSGNVLWMQSGFGYEGTALVPFEDKLYFTTNGDGMLNVVDVNTGQVMWKLFSPNSANTSTFNARFDNPPAIDPDLRRLYIADNYFLMCIPLK